MKIFLPPNSSGYKAIRLQVKLNHCSNQYAKQSFKQANVLKEMAMGAFHFWNYELCSANQSTLGNI